VSNCEDESRLYSSVTVSQSCRGSQQVVTATRQCYVKALLQLFTLKAF
jgi:hypothetical protein